MPWLIAFKEKSGYSAKNIAEDVTKGIDGYGLTAIITGVFVFVIYFTCGFGGELVRGVLGRGCGVFVGFGRSLVYLEANGVGRGRRGEEVGRRAPGGGVGG
ncbi:hypothetical protein Tco_0303483 [Tanacetum coccineum]